MSRFFKIDEAARHCDIEITQVTEWIENEWIIPAEPDDDKFDEEDVARLKLIHDLRSELGVNDESVSIILNLLDQLHQLRNRVGIEFRESRKS